MAEARLEIPSQKRKQVSACQGKRYPAWNLFGKDVTVEILSATRLFFLSLARVRRKKRIFNHGYTREIQSCWLQHLNRFFWSYSVSQ